MSLNYTMVQRPPQWVSAHRQCCFKYLPLKIPLLFYGNVGGTLVVITAGTFTTATAAPGNRIYLYATGADNRYQGFHVIKSISGLVITTETPYTGHSNTYSAALVTLPEVFIYTGYTPAQLTLPLHPTGGVDMYTIQPRYKVAQFKPEVNPDGYINFDISAYLKSVLATPYKAGYNDTEQSYQYPCTATTDYLPLNYARVEIVMEGNLECTLYAANAAISTAGLNRFYVDTGHPINPLPQPLQFANGINHYDYISATYLKRNKA